jgi:hypothetical protein
VKWNTFFNKVYGTAPCGVFGKTGCVHSEYASRRQAGVTRKKVEKLQIGTAEEVAVQRPGNAGRGKSRPFTRTITYGLKQQAAP